MARAGTRAQRIAGRRQQILDNDPVFAELDEHAPRLDLAGDLRLVEDTVRAERDEGGCRLLAVAVLERLLHRLQLGPVHARILERRGRSDSGLRITTALHRSDDNLCLGENPTSQQ